MVKNKEDLFNYVLTIAFVLLILIFLVFIVQISRYVFSDVGQIKDHVVLTHDLLEDIGDVEVAVLSKDSNLDLANDLDNVNNNINLSLINFVSFQKDLTGAAYINMNENKAVLSLVFSSEVSQIDGIYYLKIKNLSSIDKGDKILYKINELKSVFGVARVFVVHDNSLEVFDIQTKELISIDADKLLGKVILRFEE